jgi:hypothetical protein
MSLSAQVGLPQRRLKNNPDWLHGLKPVTLRVHCSSRVDAVGGAGCQEVAAMQQKKTEAWNTAVLTTSKTA